MWCAACHTPAFGEQPTRFWARWKLLRNLDVSFWNLLSIFTHSHHTLSQKSRKLWIWRQYWMWQVCRRRSLIVLLLHFKKLFFTVLIQFCKKKYIELDYRFNWIHRKNLPCVHTPECSSYGWIRQLSLCCLKKFASEKLCSRPQIWCSVKAMQSIALCHTILHFLVPTARPFAVL